MFFMDDIISKFVNYCNRSEKFLTKNTKEEKITKRKRDYYSRAGL